MWSMRSLNTTTYVLQTFLAWIKVKKNPAHSYSPVASALGIFHFFQHSCQCEGLVWTSECEFLCMFALVCSSSLHMGSCARIRITYTPLIFRIMQQVDSCSMKSASGHTNLHFDMWSWEVSRRMHICLYKFLHVYSDIEQILEMHSTG